MIKGYFGTAENQNATNGDIAELGNSLPPPLSRFSLLPSFTWSTIGATWYLGAPMLCHHSQAWATCESRSAGGGAGTRASAGSGGGRGNAAAAAAADTDADVEEQQLPPTLFLVRLEEPCFWDGAAGRIVATGRAEEAEKAELTGTTEAEAAEGRSNRPRRQHACMGQKEQQKTGGKMTLFCFFFFLFTYTRALSLSLSLSLSLYVSIFSRDSKIQILLFSLLITRQSSPPPQTP